MTTEEATVLAARLAKWWDQPPSFGIREAAQQLARAWLDLHDQTLVDESWLLSIGFDKREVPSGGSFNYWRQIDSLKEDGFYWSTWLSMFDVDGESWGFDLWSMPSNEGLGMPGAPCKTRSDVRRLMAALGIQPPSGGGKP